MEREVAIADPGNVLRHAYHHVDPDLVREIVRVHLPPLSRAVHEVLDLGDFE
jgi:uncharacterized protein with HEPN domain